MPWMSARHLVGAAAGAGRDDELDVLGRLPGLGLRRPREQPRAQPRSQRANEADNVHMLLQSSRYCRRSARVAACVHCSDPCRGNSVARLSATRLIRVKKPRSRPAAAPAPSRHRPRAARPSRPLALREPRARRAPRSPRRSAPQTISRLTPASTGLLVHECANVAVHPVADRRVGDRHLAGDEAEQRRRRW